MLGVESLTATLCGGEWMIAATIRNVHISKSVSCQGLLVSSTVISVTTKINGGFDEKIRLSPQSFYIFTTLVTGVEIRSDTKIFVWIKILDESKQSMHHGYLGSLVLRVQDLFADRNPPALTTDRGANTSILLVPENRNTQRKIPDILRSLEEVLPVTTSSDGFITHLRSTQKSSQPFRVDLRIPPGASWVCIDIYALSSSYSNMLLSTIMSIVPQGVSVQSNTLTSLPLLCQLCKSMCNELNSLSALSQDILERNRSRRKMLKIPKITLEEVSIQMGLRKQHIEQQACSDDMFACCFHLKQGLE